MVEDEQIEAFLEHHGVKGMRWGVRTRGQKVKIIGGALAGAFVGRRLTALMSAPVSAAVSAGLGVAGAKAVSGIMNEHMNKKLTKTFSKNLSDKDMHAQITEFANRAKTEKAS